jgi:hypothetical protein
MNKWIDKKGENKRMKREEQMKKYIASFEVFWDKSFKN